MVRMTELPSTSTYSYKIVLTLLTTIKVGNTAHYASCSRFASSFCVVWFICLYSTHLAMIANLVICCFGHNNFPSQQM